MEIRSEQFLGRENKLYKVLKQRDRVGVIEELRDVTCPRNVKTLGKALETELARIYKPC